MVTAEEEAMEVRVEREVKVDVAQMAQMLDLEAQERTVHDTGRMEATDQWEERAVIRVAESDSALLSLVQASCNGGDGGRGGRCGAGGKATEKAKAGLGGVGGRAGRAIPEPRSHVSGCSLEGCRVGNRMRKCGFCSTDYCDSCNTTTGGKKGRAGNKCPNCDNDKSACGRGE